jgi:predicted methyltransferase
MWIINHVHGVPDMRPLLTALSVSLLALAPVTALAAKAKKPAVAAAVDPAVAAKMDASSDATVATALTSALRTAELKERDGERHPKQMLAFAGFREDMTVVEVSPGTGYWNEIFAAALREKGKFIVGATDPNGPGRKTIATMLLKYANTPKLYDKVEVTLYKPAAKPAPAVAPAGTVDLVWIARHMHGLIGGKLADNALKIYFDALKPGGVLLIEQHRLPESRTRPDEVVGYVKTSEIVGLATAAGFKLAASSEINANPKDTADHPFGVWTLPPMRWSTKNNASIDPKFDHSKYDAIGESDRMTLKFVKP